MNVRFEKWEGLGNDFVLTEDVPGDVADDVVRRLCDRRRGVGADGVLVIEGATGAMPRMIVRNADGSRPEMCGNGLRCVASYLAMRGGGAPTDRAIATDGGEKRCLVTPVGEAAFDVSVAMGRARVGEAWSVPFEGRVHDFLRVDMGNPHAITFAPYDEAAIDRLGPYVATLPREGTNVEVCTIDARAAQTRIEVVVWERGVGRTLACGTGACAVAAAAATTGRAPFDAPIVVALPGGELTITVASSTHAVTMRGPARRVFTGVAVLA